MPNFSSTICWKDNHFPIEFPWPLYLWLTDSMGGSSSNLRFLLHQFICLSLWKHLIILNSCTWSILTLIFLKIFSAFSNTLHFHVLKTAFLYRIKTVKILLDGYKSIDCNPCDTAAIHMVQIEILRLNLPMYKYVFSFV